MKCELCAYARSDVGSPQVETVVEWLAEHRMAETLVEQAAISYNAHVEAVKKMKARISELYKMQGGGEK